MAWDPGLGQGNIDSLDGFIKVLLHLRYTMFILQDTLPDYILEGCFLFVVLGHLTIMLYHETKILYVLILVNDFQSTSSFLNLTLISQFVYLNNVTSLL